MGPISQAICRQQTHHLMPPQLPIPPRVHHSTRAPTAQRTAREICTDSHSYLQGLFALSGANSRDRIGFHHAYLTERPGAIPATFPNDRLYRYTSVDPYISSPDLRRTVVRTTDHGIAVKITISPIGYPSAERQPPVAVARFGRQGTDPGTLLGKPDQRREFTDNQHCSSLYGLRKSGD